VSLLVLPGVAFLVLHSGASLMEAGHVRGWRAEVRLEAAPKAAVSAWVLWQA
jgi:hypothetical protein